MASKSAPETLCKDAIKAWSVKNADADPTQAKKVSLICQMPPLRKMDAALNTLVNCEHLALSTNAIERINPLTGLKCLKILSLGRNNLKRIEKLEDVAATLEELWCSYNDIDKLDGLGGLKKLRVLFLSNNKIAKWDSS